MSGEFVEETTSDEGWQEANPKGRSGNAAVRRLSRRRPVTPQISIILNFGIGFSLRIMGGL